MTLKRRRFTREFKWQVLREIEAGKSIAQAAREHQVHPTLIGRWQKQQTQYAQQAFAGNGHVYMYIRRKHAWLNWSARSAN